MLVPSIFNNYFSDDFMDEMFMKPFGFGSPRIRQAAISTDIQEFDNRYELDLELPGFAKEDLNAELKDGYLTIQASRTEQKDEKDKDGRFIRQERYSGTCRRSFYVGKEITQDDIRAHFENGILKISIPKKESLPVTENTHTIAIEG